MAGAGAGVTWGVGRGTVSGTYGQLGHLAGWTMCMLVRGCRDDPRRRLELRHRQLALAVGGLLQRELLLQGGQPDLAVRQHGLTHHHRQERTDDEAYGARRS